MDEYKVFKYEEAKNMILENDICNELSHLDFIICYKNKTTEWIQIDKIKTKWHKYLNLILDEKNNRIGFCTLIEREVKWHERNKSL